MQADLYLVFLSALMACLLCSALGVTIGATIVLSMNRSHVVYTTVHAVPEGNVARVAMRRAEKGWNLLDVSPCNRKNCNGGKKSWDVLFESRGISRVAL